MSPSEQKIIAVIGATGAQGLHVIKALLSPSDNGTPSPYSVRALTRDPTSESAKELAKLGTEIEIEIVQGSFMDFASVERVLQGTYGAYVNTDGGTVGEEAEIFAGMRIFELAKQAGIRHYVWSNLEYVFKKTGYQTKYRTEHLDGKGRVAEWLKAQASEESDLTWSALTTGPYMDMLHIYMFAPINKRDDGTFVFASPIGRGHVPMISLKDLGYFARYIYDHRRETSAQNLDIASEIVGWDRLVAAFTRVTGQKAVFVSQTLDEWFDNFLDVDSPWVKAFQAGFKQGLHQDKTSFRQNFSAFWRLWRDDIVTKDMEWVKKINPNTEDLETWMRRVGYTGSYRNLLKNRVGESEDGSGLRVNVEKVKNL